MVATIRATEATIVDMAATIAAGVAAYLVVAAAEAGEVEDIEPQEAGVEEEEGPQAQEPPLVLAALVEDEEFLEE